MSRDREPRTQQLTVMTPEGTQQVHLPSLSTLKNVLWLLVTLGGLGWAGLVFTVDYRVSGQIHDVEARMQATQDTLRADLGFLMCRSALRDVQRIGPNEISAEILARPECRPWRDRR